MLPDRVSNPGPLTYESGALPIALRGPAMKLELMCTDRSGYDLEIRKITSQNRASVDVRKIILNNSGYTFIDFLCTFTSLKISHRISITHFSQYRRV